MASSQVYEILSIKYFWKIWTQCYNLHIWCSCNPIPVSLYWSYNYIGGGGGYIPTPGITGDNAQQGCNTLF